jgi:hypothetical protein
MPSKPTKRKKPSMRKRPIKRVKMQTPVIGRVGTGTAFLVVEQIPDETPKPAAPALWLLVAIGGVLVAVLAILAAGGY